MWAGVLPRIQYGVAYIVVGMLNFLLPRVRLGPEETPLGKFA